MKVLKWLDEYLEESILLVMLIAMTIIMGVQITARYAFSSSLSWSEEITRYLFIWSGFLSASYCLKKKSAIRIDLLINKFSEKGRRIVDVITYVIQLVFFAYLIPFAWNYVNASIVSGQLSPACGIPMWIIQLATVVSFTLCVIRLIQNTVKAVGKIMTMEEKEDK